MRGSHHTIAVRHGRHVTRRHAFFQQHGHDPVPDDVLAMDYYFWVITSEDTDRVILVDTGFDAAQATSRQRTVECDPRDALGRLGVDADAVEIVVVSHCHYDHIGNLSSFPSARIVLTARELDFWTRDRVAQRPLFHPHTDPAQLEVLRRAERESRVDVFDEAAEIVPGITALRMSGHTPGELVVVVRGVDGDVVLTSDALHYHEELDGDRPTAVHSDLVDVYRTFDRLRHLSDQGFTLIPGHDPQVAQDYPALKGADGVTAVLLSSRRDHTEMSDRTECRGSGAPDREVYQR